MKDTVTFFRDQFGAVAAKTETGYFIDLCSQLTSDIQTYAPDAIDLIVLIDDVESGRLTPRSGRATHTSCAPTGTA